MKSSMLLFVAIVALSESAAFGQPRAIQNTNWVPTNGPYGGWVYSLAVDRHGCIFAGTARATYRSTDGGLTWLRSGPASSSRKALAVDKAGALLAGTDSGLLRSTDDGVTWDTVGLRDWAVRSVMVHPNGKIYAAISRPTSRDLVYSVDSGSSWRSCKMSGTLVNDMLVSPNRGILVATSSSVLSWTGSDSMWTPLVSGKSFHTIVEDSAGNLFAGVELDGVLRSTRGSPTWDTTGLKMPYTVVSLAVLPGGGLLAGIVPLDPTISGGVRRTTDAGTTWYSLGLEDRQVHSILVTPNDAILLGTSRGVFRSTDLGQTWRQANEGLDAVSMNALLCTDSTTILAATSVALFRSTNNGDVWEESGRGISPASVTCLVADRSDNLFAGNMVFATGGGIFKSTDRGVSWRCTSSDTLKTNYTLIPALAVTKANNLVASAGPIYRSSDRGETWTRVRNITVAATVLAFSSDSAGSVFGATSGKGVLRSTDDGMSWDSANVGLSHRVVYCLASRAPGEVFAGGHGGVSRSTNNGDSWTTISTGLGNVIVRAMVIDVRRDLLISTSAGNVYRTTDNGLTWTEEAGGLEGMPVLSFATAGGPTFAADTLRVYRSSTSTSDVGPTSGSLPGAFRLAQNYPNPFNPSTTIKYGLPKSSLVTLSLYDLLGREVSVLVNERREAGVHEVKFDASALSSGVYFYRLQAGDFVQSRKLILLR